LERWLRERKGSAVTLAVPQRGDKLDLVKLTLKNAEDVLNKHRQSAMVKDARTTQAMLELKEALHLPALPLRIEGYDISNTQGILSIASMVVFEGGVPSKKAYRFFRIKTVEGANDFASMAEVISRRFTHGLRERQERAQAGLVLDGGSFSKLPDVVLIDGGPEQLLFAHRAMEEAGASVPMFGLAKRFEEIYLPDQQEPIVLDRRSNALHLVQFVRDEAHRFGITQHRALRGKEGLKSELGKIEGIGQKKQIALLRHFKSIKAIFEASEQELCEVDGISTVMAGRILAYARERK
ncbi:MAG: helix-hairpin-helix domain-containing protein, partial [Clostridia bacterium]